MFVYNGFLKIIVYPPIKITFLFLFKNKTKQVKEAIESLRKLQENDTEILIDNLHFFLFVLFYSGQTKKPIRSKRLLKGKETEQNLFRRVRSVNI